MTPLQYVSWSVLVIWEMAPEIRRQNIESIVHIWHEYFLDQFNLDFFRGLSSHEQVIYYDCVRFFEHLSENFTGSRWETQIFRNLIRYDWKMFWPRNDSSLPAPFSVLSDIAIEKGYCTSTPTYPNCWAIRKAREEISC